MTFAVATRTRKVSRRPCTCPTTGNIFILHKPLQSSPLTGLVKINIVHFIREEIYLETENETHE